MDQKEKAGRKARRKLRSDKVKTFQRERLIRQCREEDGDAVEISRC